MDSKIENIINELNKNDIKVQKVYHSSFSEYNDFKEDNTFTSFDFEKYGAFHGACDIDGNNGKQVAENRVFVKILEDAHKMVGVSPQLRNEIVKEHSIDFKTLEDKTGYKVANKFKNPIMIEAEVYYHNALELNENRAGQWNPHDIIREVMDKYENGEDIKGITEEDLDDYYDDNININGVAFVDLISEPYLDIEFNQDYKEFLFVRDWLESKGYDAIKYINKFEGESECIMSFKTENLKITDSYCLKPLLDIDNKNNEIRNKPKRLKL